MPEKLTYAGSVTVTDGPTLSFSRPMEVAGYDKLNLKIAPGGSAAAPLGLGTKTSLRLLAFRSSAYDDGSAKLTFELDSAAGTTRALAEPVIIAGAGAVALLGAVTTVTFKNDLTGAVTIDVLVARDTK